MEETFYVLSEPRLYNVTCYATEDTQFGLLLRFIYKLTTITYNTVAYFHLNSLKFSSSELSASDRETLITDCLLQKLFTN
jgi:hypothetical protein